MGVLSGGGEGVESGRSGGGWSGGGERRIEVIVKMQNKIGGGGVGVPVRSGGGGEGWM